jgi:hypothetical protein
MWAIKKNGREIDREKGPSPAVSIPLPSPLMSTLRNMGSMNFLGANFINKKGQSKILGTKIVSNRLKGERGQCKRIANSVTGGGMAKLVMAMFKEPSWD